MEPSLPPDPRQGARRLSRRCKYIVILNNYKEFPRLLRAEDAPFLQGCPGRFVSFQNIAAFGKTLKRDFFCRCDRKIPCRRPTFLPLRRRSLPPQEKSPCDTGPTAASFGRTGFLRARRSFDLRRIVRASSAHRRGRGRRTKGRLKSRLFDGLRYAMPASRGRRVPHKVRKRRHVRDGRKAGTLTFGDLPIE